jgi:Arc/MetJ family transcription regulator
MVDAEAGMRTTVTLDPQLLAEAQQLAGITERAALIRAGLVALIERESARRLARLGGSDPGIEVPERRRPE